MLHAAVENRRGKSERLAKRPIDETEPTLCFGGGVVSFILIIPTVSIQRRLRHSKNPTSLPGFCYYLPPFLLFRSLSIAFLRAMRAAGFFRGFFFFGLTPCVPRFQVIDDLIYCMEGSIASL